MKYIKWTSNSESNSTDDNFEHIGKFIKETDLHIHLDTKFGEMCILKTNGTFTDSTKEEFDLIKIEQEPAAKESATKEQPSSEHKTSKAERARSIYIKLHKEGKARKDIINQFKSELQMTQAGASTYYQNIKKSLS